MCLANHRYSITGLSMRIPIIVPEALEFRPELQFQRQTHPKACVSYAMAHSLMMSLFYQGISVYIDALNLYEKQIRFLGKPLSFKNSISYQEGSELLIYEGYNGIRIKPLGLIQVPELKRWIFKGYFPLLTFKSHAIVACGYDDRRGFIRVVDSQKKGFYGTLNYDDLPKLQEQPKIMFISYNSK